MTTNEDEDVPLLMAIKNISGTYNNPIVTCGLISNGSVTLNVWHGEGRPILGYSESHQKVEFIVMIFNNSTHSLFGQIMASYEDQGHGTVTVDFTDGIGNGNFATP